VLKIRYLVVLGLAALGATFAAQDAAAFGGRYFSGGHPYHNGFLFVPPASAYEPVWIRPPFRYGTPAYYFPASYLSPTSAIYPPAPYPGIPSYRAAGYYMSIHGAGNWYPE
jgi:hypothetical protein